MSSSSPSVGIDRFAERVRFAITQVRGQRYGECGGRPRAMGNTYAKIDDDLRQPRRRIFDEV